MLDSYINEEKSVRFQQDSWTLLIDLKSKFVDPEIRTAIIPNRDNSFSAIFAWAASKSLDCKKKAEHFIQQLICMAKQMSNNSYCESVIYGNECNDFSQLYGQLNQIQELIPIKTGFLYGDSISLDDLIIKHRNSMPQALKIAELLYNTAVLHKSGSYYEYNKSIEQLEYYLSANKLGTDALAPFSGFLKGYFNIDLSSRGLEYIFDTLKRLAEDWFNKNIQSSDIVNQTICFINNYYMKDIGIAQIANQLNVTPNYLSALFQKKTGENFIDYLTKTRMTKARELLLSSENPLISQISKQVGYYTVSYFTRLYKKYFGLSPSQDFSKHKEAEAFPLKKGTEKHADR